MIIGRTLTEIYEKTLDELKVASLQESQFGTTKEIINYSCCLTNPYSRLILTPNRKHSLNYLVGEFLWYMSGERDPARISHYSGFWGHLVDDKGLVNSNYGYKIFKRPVDGKSQFDWVCGELRRDRDSRRAVMVLNLEEDYAKMHETKDFPCTMYLHFLIREDRLDMMTHMRSNDFIFGACNDIPFFTLLQEIIASRLDVDVGKYYHNADSEHIYEKHFDLLEYEKDRVYVGNDEPFPLWEERDWAYLGEILFLENSVRHDQKLIPGWSLGWPRFSKFCVEIVQDFWKKKRKDGQEN